MLLGSEVMSEISPVTVLPKSEAITGENDQDKYGDSEPNT